MKTAPAKRARSKPCRRVAMSLFAWMSSAITRFLGQPGLLGMLHSEAVLVPEKLAERLHRRRAGAFHDMKDR